MSRHGEDLWFEDFIDVWNEASKVSYEEDFSESTSKRIHEYLNKVKVFFTELDGSWNQLDTKEKVESMSLRLRKVEISLFDWKDWSAKMFRERDKDSAGDLEAYLAFFSKYASQRGLALEKKLKYLKTGSYMEN